MSFFGKVTDDCICLYLLLSKLSSSYCVKSVRIRSYSGPHFAAFGLDTERYFAFLRIQSECGKKRTRIAPNTDTFYAVSRAKKFLSRNYFVILVHYCSRKILMQVILLDVQLFPNTIFSFVVLLALLSLIRSLSRIIIKLQYELQLWIFTVK